MTPASFTPQVKRILKQNDCVFHRQGIGDHEVWRTPTGHRFTVDDKIRSRHTANETLKQAGLPKAF